METWQRLTSRSKQEIVVFIGCGKKKLNRKSKAVRMYQGVYFQKCLEVARVLTTSSNIFILSAKYGLIRLDQTIAPYELKLSSLNKKQRERWQQMVKKQINLLLTSQQKKLQVVFICSRLYSSELEGIELLPKVGIGKQLKWMKGILENVHNKKEDGSGRFSSPVTSISI